MTFSTRVCLMMAATTLLTACATVESRKYIDGEASSHLRRGGAEGVVYALPRRDLRVVIERKILTKSDVTKAVEQAKTQLAASREALAQAETRRRSAVALVISLKEDSLEEAQKAARDELTDAQSKLDKARQTVKSAEERLAEAQRTAANPFANNCPRVVHAVSVAELPMRPDPNLRFRANLLHTAFRDDKLSIKLNERGLLSSTESEATDRTATIITDIARSVLLPSTPAGAVIKLNTFEMPVVRDAADECVVPSPARGEFVFDPLKTSYADLEQEMAIDELGFELRVDALGARSQDTLHPTTFSQTAWNGRRRKVEGLLYRQSLGYRVRVGNASADNGHVVYDNIHVVPNGGPIAVVPMRAGVFTTSNTTLTFKDGMLVAYDATRPSEVAQLVRIPLDVFDGLIDSVSKLIPFADSNATQAKTYAEAQAILLEATKTFGPDASEVQDGSGGD